MNTDIIISQLESNLAVFESLFENCKEELYNWRQSDEKWSLLEILCHLYDEEREDFRARVKHCLFTPDQPMPPIDPANWVKSREYSKKDFGKIKEMLFSERLVSIEWLKSLDNPNWKSSYMHPKVGPVSAGLILSNWLAHDYLHIRQIIKFKYDYLCTVLSDEKMDYAGEW